MQNSGQNTLEFHVKLPEFSSGYVRVILYVKDNFWTKCDFKQGIKDTTRVIRLF